MKEEYLKSFQEERDSAYLYLILVKYETSKQRADLFRNLAAESNKQADIWKEKLSGLGFQDLPIFAPNLRVRIVAKLIQCIGPKAILPILASMKVRGLSIYSSHTEDRHGTMKRGGNLRAAVFGVNDGLLSNASLILGIAGAAQSSEIILVSGVAGLMAGAFSMAAGEYISVKSQRELYENQIELERAELREFPEEEAAELAHIYQAKGLSATEAKALAIKMISDPEKALDALTREELGLNPLDLGSPWGAAISSFIAFSVGATVPVLPFVFMDNALKTTMIVSMAALLLVGMVISLFTGKSALYGGVRMLFVGVLAGSVTYGLGLLFAA